MRQSLEQHVDAGARDAIATVMNELRDTVAWYDALEPTFKFLFALPFIVAATGLLSDWLRTRFINRHDDAGMR